MLLRGALALALLPASKTARRGVLTGHHRSDGACTGDPSQLPARLRVAAASQDVFPDWEPQHSPTTNEHRALVDTATVWPA
jgi:hypothetical protein